MVAGGWSPGRTEVAPFTPAGSGEVVHRAAGDWRAGGALSMNYRNIGAKPIEIEIENQLALTDVYIRVDGPAQQDTPFLAEFTLDDEGRPELFRLAVKSVKLRRVELELGRFLVPFARTNELYRPDLYPLVTKPLLYASPGLDFVSRVSFPHPLFSSGYTDTGARATYTPHAEPVWFPRKLTAYVVNGLQESPIRGRRPPDPRTFLILDSVSGTDVDWGHEVNNLSDNNDTKNPGARIEWDYGDVAYPSPFSRAAFVNGFSLGLSGMIGKYDIEDRLSNWVMGADLGLRRREYRLTAEALSGEVQAKWPELGTSASAAPPLVKDRYALRGLSVQLEFPFPEFPLSKQTRVVLRGETMSRRGPVLNAFGEVVPEPLAPHHKKTWVNKFSGGFNSRVNPHFSVKLEYGLWTFGLLPSIYQVLWAGVLSF
jgi:hypothetical protein